jgi:hypothetical protein
MRKVGDKPEMREREIYIFQPPFRMIKDEIKRISMAIITYAPTSCIVAALPEKVDD